MSSSPSEGGRSQETAVTPEQWASFLADAKIIPLSLVTLHNLRQCFSLVEVKPDKPDKPDKRLRGGQTYRQSDRFRAKSMYDRVSVGGQPIHDDGLQILKGAVSIGVLKKALPFLDHVLFVETNEGNGHYKEKIEMRHRGQSGPDQDGLMDVDQLQKSLETLPDSTLVGFYLWVNPTNEGWLRLNLVLNNWDQKKVKSMPEVELEFFEVDGVPTLDLEKLGFKYS